MKKIIDHLFEGPIDIIGDIHGELDALLSLIKCLGYDENANHPEGRRLVFLGDLVDRGPYSIRLVKKVKAWVEEKKAQCILGNHELNLIKTNPNRQEKRHGNHWFLGEEEGMSPENPSYIHPQELANDEDRAWLLAFFNTLPLALENDHLAVVHACWDPKSIERLKRDQAIGHTDIPLLYKKYRNRIGFMIKSSSTKSKMKAKSH